VCWQQILAAVKPDVKLIFLCSPGNPTAKLISLDAIEAIARGGEKGICVSSYMGFLFLFF